MKKVLIATPALNEQVNTYFAHSLQESIKLSIKNDIDFNCAIESILPQVKKLGYDILIDTEYTSNHHSNKMYIGSFKDNIKS
jgi:hypothetical protein